jgi:hypothetical protein
MRLRVFHSLLIAALLLLVLPAGIVSAQKCDNASGSLAPCGALPWALPGLPVLVSPTPYQLRDTPTPIVYTATPSPTFTFTPSPTVATPTATIDNSVLHGDMATMAAGGIEVITTLDINPEISLGGSSDPVATTSASLSNYSRTFFSYVRGLTLFNMTGTGGITGWLLLALALVIGTVIATNLIPIIGAIYRLIMRVIELVAQFIPF